MSNYESIGLIIDIYHFTFDFWSFYSPPGDLIPYEFFIEYFEQKKNLFLVSDLNSKTHSLGCKSNDSSGKVLENILLNTDLIVLNNTSPKYNKFNSDYEEILDLCICSNNLSSLVNNFQVLSDHSMTSDHYPFTVELCFSGNKPEKSETNEIRFNFKKANIGYVSQYSC